jgi:acyl-coenzyme A synthetase/AMP-(fatty) acid ligase
LGTAEVESAITSHDDVAECAVVGVPHDVKGQAIFAYVILNEVFLSTFDNNNNNNNNNDNINN